jgi:hypothetical protein
MIDLKSLYEQRPFKTRNADEIELANVLDLFVDPVKSLKNPFEYENIIVKGKMGTGKTMYLKANQAYYLFTLIPTLLAEDEPIIPVYLRLSDYQHVSDPSQIYKELILRIIKELCNSFDLLSNSQKLYNLHKGFITLPGDVVNMRTGSKNILDRYRKLSSEEYVETVTKETALSASARPKILELFASYKNKEQMELRGKPNPGIVDIEEAYSKLLAPKNGKMLLLLDEAGSINRSFFRPTDDHDSYFEILMNQLRTLQFMRTKIAVYPQTYTDVLTETRYGDIVFLQEDIEDVNGYKAFRRRTESLIERYCESSTDITIGINDIFSITKDDEDPIEQLINASYGNMRRLLNLVDVAFQKTYMNDNNKMVEYTDVIQALEDNSKALESTFSESDKTFLSTLTNACKSRTTYKFSFPNNAAALYKYTNRSAEYNVINVLEAGIGRRSSVYCFDYAYCVKNGIPTHYISGSERIDRLRSRKNGAWIARITTISDEIMENAEMPGKLEGKIDFLKEGVGFIKSNDNTSYYFDKESIIEGDRAKYIHMGTSTRFYPAKIENVNFATCIEIL